MEAPRGGRGKGRGVARGQSRPVGQSTNPGNVPQFAGPRPAQGARVPRPPIPRPQVPRPQIPIPQVPRPRVSGAASSQSSPSIQVEQLKSKLDEMAMQGNPIPIGRGAIRGRQPITVEHYRAPRPESSKTSTGKQGTLGTPLNLISNYFPIKSYTNWTLFQYRVDFSPEEDKVMVQRSLLSAHKDFLGAYIFDGTMMFSSTRYPSDEFKLTSKRNSDNAIVIITVAFTSVIEPGDYTSIQIFNLLLRNCLRNLELKLVGRNFYDPVAKIRIDSLRLQLWPGYETTIGMYDSGLLLRSEISTKVMREDTVYDVLKEFMAESRYDSSWFDGFQAAIIGTTVLTRYNNLTYRIDDIDKMSTINSTFKKKDGTNICYKDYYLQKWNIKLQYSNQPLLISKKKKKFTNDGKSETELVYLIPELCTLTGISNKMRDNRNAMIELGNFTRVNPNERIIRYNNFMSRLLSTPKSVELLQKWNLRPDNELVKFKGRILPPESIASNTSKYPANNGDWTRSVQDYPMYTSVRVSSWVVIIPQQDQPHLQNFLMSLKRVSDRMSFFLPKPVTYTITDSKTPTYLTTLEKVINETNPSFVICIVPHSRGDTYSVIKRFLCVVRAVPSQIIQVHHLKKINLSVITKISVQINCKIGGAPWLVKNPRKNMLVIGFDVCHDKKNKNKSYGALVASINDEQTIYYSCVTEHVSGEELSNFFAANMIKVLHSYRTKNNNRLPGSIIIYRDGVGDGQLSYVHKVELANIKRACKEFYKDTVLQLAFIIVKKRISTRFFTDEKIPKNPPPGTVVDTIVTDPTMYDFYLVSQRSGAGTVTPVHYNVIEDTLKEWSPDKMQLLTYKFTHMYFNWSGTVRVPAMCQYAHKLAFLTGQSLQATPNTGLSELLYFL